MPIPPPLDPASVFATAPSRERASPPPETGVRVRSGAVCLAIRAASRPRAPSEFRRRSCKGVSGVRPCPPIRSGSFPSFGIGGSPLGPGTDSVYSSTAEFPGGVWRGAAAALDATAAMTAHASKTKSFLTPATTRLEGKS